MYHCCQLYPIFCGQLLYKFRHCLQKTTAVEKFVKFPPKNIHFYELLDNLKKKHLEKVNAKEYNMKRKQLNLFCLSLTLFVQVDSLSSLGISYLPF
jgi:hypothetical protein